MGIPPIDLIDAHQSVVSVALPTNSSTARPTKAYSALRSTVVICVVVTPPHALLVASLRGAVEPLIHAPQAVQSARIGRVGVVHDAVLEGEGAHARPLAHVRRRIGTGHGGEFGHWP